jgi:hypothetical protein
MPEYTLQCVGRLKGIALLETGFMELRANEIDCSVRHVFQLQDGPEWVNPGNSLPLRSVRGYLREQTFGLLPGRATCCYSPWIRARGAHRRPPAHFAPDHQIAPISASP